MPAKRLDPEVNPICRNGHDIRVKGTRKWFNRAKNIDQVACAECQRLNGARIRKALKEGRRKFYERV